MTSFKQMLREFIGLEREYWWLLGASDDGRMWFEGCYPSYPIALKASEWHPNAPCVIFPSVFNCTVSGRHGVVQDIKARLDYLKSKYEDA
jgi:hypothetical protein